MGTVSNDDTGDPFRMAYQKFNNGFANSEAASRKSVDVNAAKIAAGVFRVGCLISLERRAVPHNETRKNC